MFFHQQNEHSTIHTKFILLVKTSNFAFAKLTVAKSDQIMSFFKIKKLFHSIANLLYLETYFLGWILDMPCSFAGVFLRKEGGIQVFGCSSFIQPNSRIFIENPLASKARKKYLTKSVFSKFTSMGKSTAPLLIESIQ